MFPRGRVLAPAWDALQQHFNLLDSGGRSPSHASLFTAFTRLWGRFVVFVFHLAAGVLSQSSDDKLCKVRIGLPQPVLSESAHRGHIQ